MTMQTGCLAAIVGAVLAQIVVFVGAFLWGAVIGAGEIMASGPGHTVYGVEGGTRAIGIVAFLYAISIGIVPVIVSAVGAVIFVGLGWLLGRRGTPT